MNPDDPSASHNENTKSKNQALKDYIDKKLISKIELDKHIVG